MQYFRKSNHPTRAELDCQTHALALESRHATGAAGSDTEMEDRPLTYPPRRFALYPCCAGDIEEPRRFLAPYVDEILFCDPHRAPVWNTTYDEVGLPKATHLRGDLRKIIHTLPPICVLFYRNDSRGEGGSGLAIVGKVWLREILDRFDPHGGWIFSDGANGRYEFRRLQSDDWRAKPRYGFEFRKAEGSGILNRIGIPLEAAQLRPISPIAKQRTRLGWVPPRDFSFSDFDSLWSYCTLNDRVVPMPEQWAQLFRMLKNVAVNSSGEWSPALPLTHGFWYHSEPDTKQLRFKAHLHWAEQHGQVEEVGAFLKSLTEEHWLHRGEGSAALGNNAAT